MDFQQAVRFLPRWKGGRPAEHDENSESNWRLLGGHLCTGGTCSASTAGSAGHTLQGDRSHTSPASELPHYRHGWHEQPHLGHCLARRQRCRGSQSVSCLVSLHEESIWYAQLNLSVSSWTDSVPYTRYRCRQRCLGYTFQISWSPIRCVWRR